MLFLKIIMWILVGIMALLTLALAFVGFLAVGAIIERVHNERKY